MEQELGWFDKEFKRKVLELFGQQISLSQHEIALAQQQLKLSEEILRRLPPSPPQPSTKSITIKFKGETPMPNNALTLTVGQTSQASIVPLLADGVTPSGGVLSAVSFSFSDPSATVSLNSDNLTTTMTGVAASSGSGAVGSASCTVTDTDGAVSTWTQAFTITVNAPPPPAQLTQSVAVMFSTPTP